MKIIKNSGEFYQYKSEISYNGNFIRNYHEPKSYPCLISHAYAKLNLDGTIQSPRIDAELVLFFLYPEDLKIFMYQHDFDELINKD